MISLDYLFFMHMHDSGNVTLITLNEYMPKELRRMENIYMRLGIKLMERNLLLMKP